MKALAKNYVFNHCVIGETNSKMYLSGPVTFPDFQETGPRALNCSSFVSLDGYFIHKSMFNFPMEGDNGGLDFMKTAASLC